MIYENNEDIVSSWTFNTDDRPKIPLIEFDTYDSNLGPSIMLFMTTYLTNNIEKHFKKHKILTKKQHKKIFEDTKKEVIKKMVGDRK